MGLGWPSSIDHARIPWWRYDVVVYAKLADYGPSPGLADQRYRKGKKKTEPNQTKPRGHGSFHDISSQFAKVVGSLTS